MRKEKKVQTDSVTALEVSEVEALQITRESAGIPAATPGYRAFEESQVWLLEQSAYLLVHC
ncbi:MAG: hypothetical protein ACP5R2_15425 [Anaerolineae bacterium]